jgi:tetratricopeptide (TPR) repeat protein
MPISPCYTGCMRPVSSRKIANAGAARAQAGVIRTMRWRLATAVACAALAACTTAGQLLLAVIPDGTIPILLGNLARESDTNRRRVAQLEQAGDWEGLAKFASENIAREPHNASWWMVAGYAHSRQMQHARAIECFREMVRLEPQAPEGWNLLAQEYRAAGDSQRAAEVLLQALTAVRDSPLTLLLLGESYSDLGRFEPAARAYRQALDLDGGLTPAWIGLARSQIKLGRVVEAESIARAVEKSNPQLAVAIRNEIATAHSR